MQEFNLDSEVIALINDYVEVSSLSTATSVGQMSLSMASTYIC